MTSIVSNPTENIVECCDLTVVRDSKEILCEATCCVPRNSLTFLVGENGSGKTTLVKTILGLLPKHSGDITIYSEKGKNSDMVAGYVPQGITFPKQLQMTVTEYLRYSSQVKTEDIESVLSRVDFPQTHSEHTINQLSGGQQQKLLLAAELARSPEVLFLDEPISNVEDSSE